jgi:Ca2+-transporting ATPase
MFLMLLAAGSIYLALGDRAEALLLGFVFVVIGITLAQERKTQRALESLRDLSAPRALVIRDGQEAAHRRARRGARRPAGAARGRPHRRRRPADQRPADRGRIAADRRSRARGQAARQPEPQASASAWGPGHPLARGGRGRQRGRRQASPLERSHEAKRGAPATPGRRRHAPICLPAPWSRGCGAGAGVRHRRRHGRGPHWPGLAATVPSRPRALQQARAAWSRNSPWRAGAGHRADPARLVVERPPLLESLLSGIALAMAILPEEIPVILTVFLALGAWRISQQKVLTRRMSPPSRRWAPSPCWPPTRPARSP